MDFKMRTLLTIVASTILLLAPAGATSRHVAPAHAPTLVSVTDGMSILLPGGWTACDAPTARLLGSAPYPANVYPCKDLDSSGGAKILFGNDPTHPLLISMAFSPSIPIQPGFLETATPALMKAFADSNCEKTFQIHVGPPGVTGNSQCRYVVETIGGRLALVAYVTTPHPNGVASSLRSVIVPFHGGGAILLFALPDDNAQAAVDGILASLAFDGPAPVMPVTSLVALSPIAGVTLSVPDSWDACDDANNARLGGKTVPFKLKAAECHGSAFDFEAYNAGTFVLAALRLKRSEGKNPLLEKFTDQSTPESLAPFKDELCREASARHLAATVVLDSCDIAVGTLAGHRALVFEMALHRRDLAIDGASRIYCREYDFSYGGAFLTVLIDTPVYYKSAAIPLLETILASLKAE